VSERKPQRLKSQDKPKVAVEIVIVYMKMTLIMMWRIWLGGWCSWEREGEFGASNYNSQICIKLFLSLMTLILCTVEKPSMAFVEHLYLCILSCSIFS